MTVFPKLLFLIGFLFASMSCFSLQSQHPGFKPVQDPATFAKKFKEASLKVQTITSDFKQEKNLAAITEKITSNGKFWFKRNNKVRLDYTSPFLYKLIINEDKIYIQDDQREKDLNEGEPALPRDRAIKSRPGCALLVFGCGIVFNRFAIVGNRRINYVIILRIRSRLFAKLRNATEKLKQQESK